MSLAKISHAMPSHDGRTGERAQELDDLSDQISEIPLNQETSLLAALRYVLGQTNTPTGDLKIQIFPFTSLWNGIVAARMLAPSCRCMLLTLIVSTLLGRTNPLLEKPRPPDFTGPKDQATSIASRPIELRAQISVPPIDK